MFKSAAIDDFEALLTLAFFAALFLRCENIEIYEVEGEFQVKNWTISLEEQGKFKVGVVPADGLDRLLLIFFLYLLNGAV
jgi:hypothetical protein